LCPGPGCSAGIEILFAPGEHEVEVKLNDGFVRAAGYTPLRVEFESGVTYVLNSDMEGGRVRYSVLRHRGRYASAP
jgi:hypothetical protein